MKFTHPHRFPEYIEEENDLKPDEENHTLCKACTLPIFSTPLHKNVNFPLHKDCAKLPMSLNGHFMHPKEPLLLRKTLLLPHYGGPLCWHCKKECKGFIYRCPDFACRFVLHVLCAVPIGKIKVLHRSHEHELVPITAEVSVPCRVCDSDHRGPSYFCNACNFWIHQDCARLPIKITREDHQHILILTYSSSQAQMIRREARKCAICRREIFSVGSYICTGCEYVAHIKCATSDSQSFSTALKEVNSLIHLPMVDEQTSLVHYLLDNNKSIEQKDLIHSEIFFSFKENHEHPLIYRDHTSIYTEDEEDHKYRLCNRCISPISLPFYCCPKCSDFFLHSCCAILSSKFQLQCNTVEDFSTALKEDNSLIHLPMVDEQTSSVYFIDNKSIGKDLVHSKKLFLFKENHEHPLIYHDHNSIYTKDEEDHKYRLCNRCNSPISLPFYRCPECSDFFFHIGCAILPLKFQLQCNIFEDFSTALKEDSSLIHLPMDEQTSLARYSLDNKSIEKKDLVHSEKLFLFTEKHEHPLIYNDHTSIYTKDEEDNKFRLCNGCISPISLPFYRCPECSDFFLHSCCAILPLKFQPQSNIVKEPHVLWVQSKSKDEWPSAFQCVMCNCTSNGFVYTKYVKDTYLGEEYHRNMDVECTFLPKYITHEAHPKSHFIFLAEFGGSFDKCICCGEAKGTSPVWYECSVCRHFKIHIRCAKLPMTVTHKFDKHHLVLSKLLPTTELDDDRFCEICEVDINTKLWYYGCDKCDNWFHIDCIPIVGELSKIKFGGTIRVQCHDCPLTSIRLLAEYNHKCGICKNNIQGFVDEVAFECSKCVFRVHYSCLKGERSIRDSAVRFSAKFR